MDAAVAQSHAHSSLHEKKVIWLACQMEKREKKVMKVGGKLLCEEYIKY